MNENIKTCLIEGIIKFFCGHNIRILIIYTNIFLYRIYSEFLFAYHISLIVARLKLLHTFHRLRLIQAGHRPFLKHNKNWAMTGEVFDLLILRRVVIGFYFELYFLQWFYPLTYLNRFVRRLRDALGWRLWYLFSIRRDG